jgi:hypothetical protein
MIEGELACIIFPSRCNVLFGNAHVLVPKVKLSCNVVIDSMSVLVLKGKLACTRFLSRFNVIGNTVVVVLEGS